MRNKLAIKAARRVGMGNHDTVVENAQPGLMLKMPIELVNLTSKCVSCHSGYRLGR